jgi:predicted Zn-dependent protease
VALLRELGEPLGVPELGALALSYAQARGDSDAATALLGDATRQGRGGEAIAAAVVVGRSVDAGRGAFSRDDQISSLDEAVALSPDAAPVRLLRAQILLEAERSAEALADADAAIALLPGDPRPQLLRGRALLGLGRAEEARAELDALLETPFARSEPSVLGYAARARLAAGDSAAATALVESMVRERHPSWHEGWVLLATEYERSGRADDAARARRNADAIVKNRAAQYRHDALASLWSGAEEDAIVGFATAIQLDPDDARSQQDLEALLARRAAAR